MSDITPEEIAELREDAAAHLATSKATEAERALAHERRTHASRGTARIAAERLRQVEAEGWTPEHDQEHDACELTRAAAAYLFEAVTTANGACWPEDDPPGPPSPWPWDESWWKPSLDPIRNLEKAGALIAAEIDRLLSSPSAAQPGADTTEGGGS